MHKIIIYLVKIFILTIAVNVYAVEYQATISYENSLKLNSPVNSRILQVAKQGSYYSKGQVLIKFDQQIINNTLKLKQQQLKLAQLNFAEQEKEMERSQELYDANNLADYDLKKAQMNLLQAEINLQSMSNELAENQWIQKFYNLKAPTNGFLVYSNVYEGQYINNKFLTTPLLHFIPADKIFAKLYLDKNELTKLSLTTANKEISLNFQEHLITGKLITIHQRANQIILDIKLNKSTQLPVEKSTVKIRVNDNKE